MSANAKENSDLLAPSKGEYLGVEPNGNLDQNERSRGPPDGGIRAYSVVVASFLTNGLLFAVMNSNSVIYDELLQQLKAKNVQNAEVRASLVGVLSIGTTFMLSPLSAALTGLMGLRRTAIIGGLIATFGLFLSSFVVHNVDALCFTYGLMYGVGCSLAYTPSLAILGQYFKKYLGIVNGIVTIGSSVFTVFMPIIMDKMIKHYDLSWMFRLLALFTTGISLCGMIFTPIPVVVIEKQDKNESTCESFFKTIGNGQLWKNKKYRLWAMSMPIALFGYFVPYVHIKDFIKESYSGIGNDNLPLQCIAITSAIGRITFGSLSDKKCIDRIFLQQVSFYMIGTLTIILPLVRNFTGLVVISLGMGLFEGGFIALIGPIAFELVGGTHAAQAIGCMLGIASVPLCVGPPVAGALHAHYKSYTIPFILAGISPLIGSTLMFSIRFLTRSTTSNRRTDLGKTPMPLLHSNGQADHSRP